MQKKTTFILIIIFAIIAALGGIGYLVVQDRFGGTVYYTHTQGDGKKKIVKAEDGNQITEYEYTFHGYDKDGNRKECDLMKVDSSMTKDKYIAVTYNKNRGVVLWQEVQKSDIPAPAMDKLNADLNAGSAK